MLAHELYALGAVGGANDLIALRHQHRLDEVEFERFVVDHDDRSRVTADHAGGTAAGARPRAGAAAPQ